MILSSTLQNGAMMIFKNLSFLQTFVTPSGTQIDQLVKKICQLEDFYGEFKITFDNNNSYHWTTSECTWKDLSFTLFISACPIDGGETIQEMETIRNNKGETDTYIIKVLSIHSKTALDEAQVKIMIDQLYNKILTVSNSIYFNRFYMRKDYGI